MSTTTNTNNLGRLESVDLREIWAKEATDFTPWLAREENIALLGDTIGIDLELEAQEKDVGPFRADILCKDTVTDHWVLVENQVERTDHTHLGQLMTYAAGLKAVSIVWVARRFTEEHRAALDWLNEITDDRFNFFGLEIELWKIGDSPVAPKFNIVSKPNDWSRNVSAGVSKVEKAAMTEAKQLQLDFWTAFRGHVLSHDSRIKPTKPQPQHWMNTAIGRSGFSLAAIASLWDSVAQNYNSNELRAELSMSDRHSKLYFEKLASMKEQVEAELGETLTWYNPPEKKVCTIHLRRTADIRDRDDWPNQHAWLLKKLDALHQVFSHRVKALDADELTKEGVAEV